MARPGNNILTAAVAAARALRSRSGRWAIVDFTEKGPTGPTDLRSFKQFTETFGGPVSWSCAYVCAWVFFRLGGELLIVSRELGPAPVKSSLLAAGTSGNTLKIEAKTAGAWGDLLQAEVVASGGNRTINIYDPAISTSVPVDSSGVQTTKQALIDWTATSTYAIVTDGGGSGLPNALSKTVLAGGTDDHASATDTHVQAAVDRIPGSLGPMNISAPGRTTSTVHAILRAHGKAYDRPALLDFVDTAVKADLKTATATERTAADSGRGAGFTPWVKVDGLAPGTTRTVPPCAFAAALMAANDGKNSVNEAVAGDNGTISPVAIGLTVNWSEDDMQELSCPELSFSSHGSLNVIREVEPGVFQIYGNRTLTDPVTNEIDLQLSNVRFDCALNDELKTATKPFVFKNVDAKGRLAGALDTAITKVMRRHYDQEALDGETEDDAFLVETGPQVNTVETRAAKKLLAEVRYIRTGCAEEVTTSVIRYAVGTSIAS